MEVTPEEKRFLLKHVPMFYGVKNLVVVGCPSRTWYRDIAQLRLLLALASDASRGLTVISAGRPPFDTVLEEAAFDLEIDVHELYDVPLPLRLGGKFRRDPYILELADLVVLFPDFRSEDPRSADPLLLQGVDLGDRVLVVTRMGG